MLLKKSSTGDLYCWTPQLAQRQDMVPYIGEPDRTKDITYMPVIPKLGGPVVKFHLEAKGIGDAICALYAACGIANQGPQVELHTRHAAWMRVEHPGVSIIQSETGPFDCSANYRDQLYASLEGRISTRVDWYLKNITQAYGLGEIQPARPQSVHATQGKPYVVLSPFSSNDSRDWHWTHYRRLTKALLDAGIRVIVCVAGADRTRAFDAFYGLNVEQRVGAAPAEVIDLVAGARVLVANDSGMAHIGGLYQAPTICLLAQFDPAYLFKCADTVRGIRAQTSCSGCHTIPAAGWDLVCNKGCSALQTITPDLVIQQVKEIYETA